MSDVRKFIESQLLEPLKYYPTVIQETMLELIIDKLEELYNYTIKFPEIISPNSNRLDILKAIADQFVFTIRDDADLEEQVNILDNIIHLYKRRGSVDTIENMWRYYGGTLPKNVQVVIPSYKLFRYSVSSLSGTHAFTNDPDRTKQGTYHRSGVYEIKLINNNYPIPDLKEFLLKELVAAGNRIYFTNILHTDLLSGIEATNPYKYEVYPETLRELQLEAFIPTRRGITWSGSDPLSRRSDYSKLSGRLVIYLEVDLLKNLDMINLDYSLYESAIEVSNIPTISSIVYTTTTRYRIETSTLEFLDCTIPDSPLSISRYLYNNQGEIIESPYTGYFVLGTTLLGEEVI